MSTQTYTPVTVKTLQRIAREFDKLKMPIIKIGEEEYYQSLPENIYEVKKELEKEIEMMLSQAAGIRSMQEDNSRITSVMDAILVMAPFSEEERKNLSLLLEILGNLVEKIDQDRKAASV